MKHIAHAASSGARSLLWPTHLLTAILALAGCVSNPEPISFEKMGGQQRWTASDVVDVTLSEKDRNRTDEHYSRSAEHPDTFATGPIWSKIFVGDPLKSPVFTIRSAKIWHETVAGGFSTRYHYDIEGTLSFEGRDYPISAAGARAAGGFPFPAISEAIQLGIVDAAHKVQYVIAGSPKH
jgi:hypothetical protein